MMNIKNWDKEVEVIFLYLDLFFYYRVMKLKVLDFQLSIFLKLFIFGIGYSERTSPRISRRLHIWNRKLAIQFEIRDRGVVICVGLNRFSIIIEPVYFCFPIRYSLKYSTVSGL